MCASNQMSCRVNFLTRPWVLVQVEDFNHSNVNSLQEYDDEADLGDLNFEDIFKRPLNGDHLRNLRYLHRYISQLYEQVNILFDYLPSILLNYLPKVCCAGSKNHVV